MQTWKNVLADRIPAHLAEEIDVFERQIELRKQGRIDEKLFAETRLRRGVYGQRYDNGHRNDGEKSRVIDYPSPDLKKGPDTLWDAPGMQRIKIPYGGLDAVQMEVLADLAEEYSDGILHVTTRQDFQLHFISIDDTPDLMRRLAAAGITTREACGNTVRNVCACPIAGVCRDESFDVTPYAQACTRFLLGHKDTQDFGRKFKVAFSGCRDHACGLGFMHDVGAIARLRTVDGRTERGFEFLVGGGLGPVPYQAKVLSEFLPEAEFLPVCQAIARIFARLGEKKNRSRARLKFLVDKLGIEEFRRLVNEERKILPHDDNWTNWIPAAHGYAEQALHNPGALPESGAPAGFEKWLTTNVYRQKQSGYAAVTVTLPLGDISSSRMRRLADVVRRFVADTVRTSVEQNLLIRWVSESDLPALYSALAEIDLAEPGAQTIVDIVACPGTDTCKLGIASSRGLAAELRKRLAARSLQYDAAVRDLRIKISGCFNSCGQHHIAELGFYGTNRKIGSYSVPHFQVFLGGHFDANADAYGLGLGAVPSKRIPEVVDRYINRYMRERQGSETFRAFIERLGKKEAKVMIQDLTDVPAHDDAPELYVDWGDAREFTIGDLGHGECAGEVVSVVEFDLAAAERQVFDAQLALESGGGPDSSGKAAGLAGDAMLTAARGLVKMYNIDVSDDPDAVAAEFRLRFVEPGHFNANFANYFFLQLQSRGASPSETDARQRIEEAQLFVEASHACHNKVLSLPPAPIR